MRIASPAFCGRMFFVRFDFIYLYGVVIAHIDTFAAIIANFCRVEVAKHTFAAIITVRVSNSLSFNGAKFVKSVLNSLVIRFSMTAFVCLDFPKFIAIKMLRT